MAIQNLVSASLTDDDRTAIKQALQTIFNKMPFLINLTEEQRESGLKLGDKTVGFLEKFQTYSKTNPEFILPYLDTEEYAKDYALIKDLSEYIRIIRPLLRMVEDTYTEVGIEALAAALLYYGSVKEASKRGVPGAKIIYEDMKKRFPGASGSTTDTTDATKTT